MDPLTGLADQRARSTIDTATRRSIGSWLGSACSSRSVVELVRWAHGSAATSSPDLLEAADDALVEAKQQGFGGLSFSRRL